MSAAKEAYRADDLTRLRLGIYPESAVVFEATPKFIPVLLELAEFLTPSDLAGLLELIGLIADLQREYDGKSVPDSVPVDEEDYWRDARLVGESYRIICDRLEQFLNWLHHPSSDVRVGAAFVLGKVAQVKNRPNDDSKHRYGTIVAALHGLLDQGPETIDRVGAIHALADAEAWTEIESIITREVEAEVIVAATLNLLEHDRRHDVAPLLRETFATFEATPESDAEIEEMFAMLPWSDIMVSGLVHTQLNRIDSD